MSKKHDDIDAAAELLLEWVASRDPNYRHRLRLARDEFHWSARTQLGAYVAYVLENDLQMVVPKHEAFAPEVAPMATEQQCEWCHRMFAPAWRGQRFCRHDGNLCADQALAAERANAADASVVNDTAAAG